MTSHVTCVVYASSWRGVLFLSIMPNLARSFIDCTGIGIGRPYHPSCCIPQIVDRNTVNPTFIVRPVTVDRWELDVNISWAKPQGEMNFDAYGVHRLDYTRLPPVIASCDDYYSNLIIVQVEWILFRNVPFGSTPFFIVFTANRTAELINREQSIKEIAMADCYDSTRSISFCRTQSIEVAGSPIDLRVDLIIAEEQAGDATPIVSVMVSWNPPVQIKSNATLVGFALVWYMNEAVQLPAVNIAVPMSMREYDDPFSLSFNHSIQGVEVTNENNFRVQVRAKINDTECSGVTCLGNEAVLSFSVGPENVTTVLPDSPTSTISGPNDPTPSILPYVLAGVATLLLCLLLPVLFRHLRKQRRPDSMSQFIPDHEESNYASKSISISNVMDESFSHFECDRNALTEISPISQIGKGSFGVVYKAFAYGTVSGKLGYYPVAIKGLKENATRDLKESFLEEIRLMIDIGRHPNILAILGCCTVDEPYLLITEFMTYGDLLHFLWKTRESKLTEEDPVYQLTELNLFQIARQVACGMEYLSQTRYYHGDLAARNILVGKNLLVKVSDFGLSDDTYEMGYKRLDEGRKRAVKWVSLETNTTNRCSIKSDVWSFGIVLYEIFTRGNAPYQGLSNQEVIEKLKSGYRMERPKDCPSDVYAMMRKCWQENPSKRPSFTDLYQSLDKMLGQHSDYLNFEESETCPGESKDVRTEGEQSQDSSLSSGKPDELKLWLHLNGSFPGGTKTIDFVPFNQVGENFTQSNNSSSRSVELEEKIFKRDRDCDVLTA
ncbi:fibroblast growth factor receptor 4-like isoform X2 [Acanthaster planci]|uniref:Fibroblast growth factor receptor 4-like isoform X2 n=1 Tax=Acanthaster planci TaxID=133434 RepID=A0A8B7YI23_ACAPL|nr:fibroblast growth factor receptor 4-like isoform X2 [Acanthaster planci]